MADGEARAALHELIELLQELDRRYLSPEWNVNGPGDVAEAARAVMHMLQGGLVGHFEDSPDHPLFRRIVAPWRKFTGDNPDAIYYEAPVRSGLAYRVRGKMGGAVYVSITIECGGEQRRFPERTGGVINDTQFDVAPDGGFEIWLGGPERKRGWLPLPPDAWRLTTRHYFEEARPVAADPQRVVPLSIEVVGPKPPPPPAPDDVSVAAGIRRAAAFVRARTLEIPPMGQRAQPAFVGRTPNQFPAPVSPGDGALSALDAHYSLAPYLLGPDQALEITGRWPRCRSGHVCLWTRHQMTYDYANRSTGLNRKQTRLEPDGSFRMVLAHRDPGLPNWLDTEGRPFGLLFWRFFLAEGPVETPRARVVPFADLHG